MPAPTPPSPPASAPEERTPFAVIAQQTEAQVAPEAGELPEAQIAEPDVKSETSPLKDIFFDFDQAAIREDAKKALAENVKWLMANPEVKVTIEGHADERGISEYNLALGERRARATRDYLVAAGIEANRINTISFGKERPFVSGHDESAWKWNRRTHFVLLPPRQHAYDLLTKFDGERQGYGMYTYVLFGRKVGRNAPALPEDVANRYRALLEAIESSTGPADLLKMAEVPKKKTNLFCVLGRRADPNSRLTLDNYNSDLATMYRIVAQGGIAADTGFSQRLATGPGPFLISSLQPLNQVRTPGPMLFSDLSATNPAAMREVVAAYKQRLSNAALDRAETFQPLRLALLNLILDADDYVRLVKDAVAAWRSIVR
jgi:peptidoglycan-associated lipoprotein